MQGVGAFEEVALAAGYLVGLESKFLCYTVIHSCKVDCFCSSCPINDFLGNREGESAFYLFGKSGDIHFPSGELAYDGFLKKHLFHHALGCGDCVFPSAAQYISVSASFFERGRLVCGQCKETLSPFGATAAASFRPLFAQFACERQSLFGAAGVG